VARNELFGKLLHDIAHTTAYLAEHDPSSSQTFSSFPLDLLLDAPLLSSTGQSYASGTTISTGIRDLIGKIGEKISLRRAVATVSPRIPYGTTGRRLASYAHGSVHFPSQGRIAALVSTNLASTQLSTLLKSESFLKDLADLEMAVVRQVVGFPTMSITQGSKDSTLDSEQVLYTQPFLMYAAANGRSVHEVLAEWAQTRGMSESGSQGGIEVEQFVKWTVGGDEVIASHHNN